jgi:endonuclease-8
VPEGDDIHALAERLHGALSGSALTEADFRVPRLATTHISGQTVVRVHARGKHLLIETSEAHTIHVHLKMDGEMRLFRSRRAYLGHDVRLALRTYRWTVVGSRLGVLEVWRSAEEDRRLSHLGPDVLGPDWDPGEGVRRLTADPEREIGVALVDQRVMAGPGNVYKSEACFLRGVHPATRVGAVRDPASLVGLVKAHGGEPRPVAAGHDRRHQAGEEAVGVRTGRAALPSLRHSDRAHPAGIGARGPDHVPVPLLSACPCLPGEPVVVSPEMRPATHVAH